MGGSGVVMGVAIAVACIVAIWVALRLAWWLSAERRACRAACEAASALRSVAAALREAVDHARRDLTERARAYVQVQRKEARQAFPIEDLREHGAKGVRWGAFLDAGVRTLEDVVRVTRADLERIPGVGGASAKRILEAAGAAVARMETEPARVPDPHRLHPEAVAFVAAAARARQVRDDLVPLAKEIEASAGGIGDQGDRLARRATPLRWVFGGKRRGDPSSLLATAHNLLGEARAVLEGPSAARARELVLKIESRWGGKARDAGELPAHARRAFPELEGELETVLAELGAPTSRHPRGGESRRPEAIIVTTPTAVPAPTQSSQTRTVRASAALPRGSGHWVPEGREVEVQGYRIPGGMIYVGETSTSDSPFGNEDPAFINPRLPVNRRAPARDGRGMTYWPSYSGISPECRAAYLEWLSAGRSDPSAYIGYVFLFFYGLERRLLHDAPEDPVARAETEAIVREVRRLLGIYGTNGSFRGYATGLLEAVRGHELMYERVYEGKPQVQDGSASGDLPLDLRIGLGQLVAQSRPIPGDWAFAWLRADPSAYLRSPAQRCPEEFEQLFQLRYASAFGEGLRVPRNRKQLVVRYRPASAGFAGTVEIPLGDLPDVSSLTAPVQKLRDLAEGCTDALAPYARWVARNPEARGSLGAAALLPAELAATVRGERIDALCEWVGRTLGDRAAGAGSAAELAAIWSGDGDQRLAKTEAVLLAQFLEKRGFGIEPDVRFGGEAPEPDRRVVVFRHDGVPASAPSPGYAAVATLLRIGSCLAHADGTLSDAERRHLEERLEAAADLTASERARLRAHLLWLLDSPVGMAGLKKRVQALGQAERTQVGEFLVSMAAADGRIEAGEIKTLLKVFPILGLGAADVYASLHRFGTDAPSMPVTVKAAGPTDAAYAIPSAPERPAGTVTLDPSKIRAKIKESEAVFGILHGIFAAEEPAAPAPAVPAAPGIWGLDPAHAALVSEVAGQPSWSRTDFDAAASRFSLLPDGAIETINDAAFEACGNLLIEGADPLDIQTHLLQEHPA